MFSNQIYEKLDVIDKKHTCCIVGSPNFDGSNSFEVNDLESIISHMVGTALADGYDTFMLCMSNVIELLSAEIVNSLRHENFPNTKIKIVCVLPYAKVGTKINLPAICRYAYGLVANSCSKIEIMSPDCNEKAFDDATSFLLNNCSRVLALLMNDSEDSQIKKLLKSANDRKIDTCVAQWNGCYFKI